MTNRITATLAACLIAIAAGCGTDGIVKVAGDVSFKGQPIEKGEIIFTSTDGKQSIASAIANGRYEAEVPPGSHKVQISAYRDVPGKVDRSNPGEEVPIVEMYIPSQYNARTSLEARIDSNTDQLNFPLS